MKLYLCARWGRRDELREYAADATRNGLHVVSRWLYSTDDDANRDPDYMARYANKNLQDLHEADALVCFTESDDSPAKGRGGRHVEFGWALAMRKRLIVVGPYESAFHALAFKQFTTWPEALAYLRPKSEYQESWFFDHIDAEGKRALETGGA